MLTSIIQKNKDKNHYNSKFAIRNICKSKNLCIYKYYENCGF